MSIVIRMNLIKRSIMSIRVISLTVSSLMEKVTITVDLYGLCHLHQLLCQHFLMMCVEFLVKQIRRLCLATLAWILLSYNIKSCHHWGRRRAAEEMQRNRKKAAMHGFHFSVGRFLLFFCHRQSFGCFCLPCICHMKFWLVPDTELARSNKQPYPFG